MKGIGRGAFSHHFKELAVRFCLGFVIGKCVQLYCFGPKAAPDVILHREGENKVIVVDEDSLEYAAAVKQEYRGGTAQGMMGNVYPGRIRD